MVTPTSGCSLLFAALVHLLVECLGKHALTFRMPDEACDGRNVALIDKCFMVCSIVQRRINC